MIFVREAPCSLTVFILHFFPTTLSVVAEVQPVQNILAITGSFSVMSQREPRANRHFVVRALAIIESYRQCRRAAANLLGCSSSSPYAAIHTAVKSAAAPARDGRARPAAIAVQTRPVAVLHTGGITVIASSPYLASRLTPIRVHIAALALHGVLAPTGGR
jgi:hypothetical protein